MSTPAELVYESPSLRILEMSSPVGIRLVGHVELGDRAELERVLKRMFGIHRDLYVDVADVEFMDVGGMRTIFDVGAYVADDGGRLILLDPNTLIQRLINICTGISLARVEVARRADIPELTGQS